MTTTVITAKGNEMKLIERFEGLNNRSTLDLSVFGEVKIYGRDMAEFFIQNDGSVKFAFEDRVKLNGKVQSIKIWGEVSEMSENFKNWVNAKQQQKLNLKNSIHNAKISQEYGF